MTTSIEPGLYVVATPIGNLGDLSERAIETLRSATTVAAEDTRTSGMLVKRAGGSGRMLSLTEHNVGQRIPPLRVTTTSVSAAATGATSIGEYWRVLSRFSM